MALAGAALIAAGDWTGSAARSRAPALARGGGGDAVRATTSSAAACATRCRCPPTSSACGPRPRRRSPSWSRSAAAPRSPATRRARWPWLLALALVPTRRRPRPGQPLAALLPRARRSACSSSASRWRRRSLAYAGLRRAPGSAHAGRRRARAGRPRARRRASESRVNALQARPRPVHRAARSRCASIPAPAPRCPRSPARRSSPACPASPRGARLTLEDYARLPGPARHAALDVAAQGARGRRAAPTPRWTRSCSPTARTRSRRRRSCSTSRSTPDKPVVFCGAMRTVSERGLGRARQPAWPRCAPPSTPTRAGRGVLIAVGEEVHAAAEATKWHTQSLDAFRSPHGPLGVARARPGRVPPARRSAPGPPAGAAPRARGGPAHDGGRRGRRAAARVDRPRRPRARARGDRLRQRPARRCCPGSRPRWPAACPWSWCRAAPRAASRPPTGTKAAARCCASWASSSARTCPGQKARIKLMVALGDQLRPGRRAAGVRGRGPPVGTPR